MCPVPGPVAEDMGVREGWAGGTEGGVFSGGLGWFSGRRLTFPLCAAGSWWWGRRRTLGCVTGVRLGGLPLVERVPCTSRSQGNRSVILRPQTWNRT